MDVRPKEKVPLKRASGLRSQTYHVPRKYPLVTPKSEARSEISVKIGIYKVKVKKIVSDFYLSYIYKGVNNEHEFLDSTLTYPIFEVESIGDGPRVP